jgi:hypothetical protein
MTIDAISQQAVTPTIAIRHRERNKQILFASYEHAYLSDKPPVTNEITQAVRSADVVRCLTVVARRPTAMLGGWSQIADQFGVASRSINYFGRNYLTVLFPRPLTDISIRKRLLQYLRRSPPSTAHSEMCLELVWIAWQGHFAREPSLIAQSILASHLKQCCCTVRAR